MQIFPAADTVRVTLGLEDVNSVPDFHLRLGLCIIFACIRQKSALPVCVNQPQVLRGYLNKNLAARKYDGMSGLFRFFTLLMLFRFFTLLVLFAALLIRTLPLTAQAKLNTIQDIRIVSEGKNKDLILLKFTERPLFEVIAGFDKATMTVKLYGTQSALKNAVQRTAGIYTTGYEIKKISETEVWLVVRFNNTSLQFQNDITRIKDGYLGFEIIPAQSGIFRNLFYTLLKGKITKIKDAERLTFGFNALPNYTVREVELPYYRLEIEFPQTSSAVKQELEGYAPNIIRPVKFIEEDRTLKVILEPLRYGLNFKVIKDEVNKQIIIDYSDSPLKPVIDPGEQHRFQTQEYTQVPGNLDPERLERLKKDFIEAEILYRQNSYDRAAKEFDIIYRKTPDSPLGIRALFRKADSYYAKYLNSKQVNVRRPVIDDYLNAFNIAQNNKYNGIENQRALANIAETYRAFNYYEEALSFYEELRKYEGPYGVEALYYIGEIYYRKRQFDKSEMIFKEFLDRHTTSNLYANALYMQGDNYFQMKRYDKAAELFSRAQNINPDIPRSNPELLYDMAEVYLEAGYSERARSLYETLTDLYPDSPFINYISIRLGDYLRDNDQKQSAISVYSRVIDKLPHELGITARMRIANIWSEDVSPDNYDKAINFYDFVTERYANTLFSEEALFRTALTLGFQKRYDLSVKELEIFRDSYPFNAYVRSKEVDRRIIDVINTAQTDYYTEGKHIISAQMYTNYLKYLSPHKSNYNYIFGAVSSEKAGLFNSANSIYETVIDSKNDYNNDLLMYMIINNHLQQKNIQKAYQYINRLLDQYPQSIYYPLALKLKADTLFAQNQTEEALNIYNQVIDKYESSSNPLLFDPVNQSMYAVGEIYRETGRFDRAGQFYAKTLFNFKYPLNDKRVPDYIKNTAYRNGEMEYELNEEDDAKASLLKAIAYFPDYDRMPWAKYYLGQIYIREKQPDLALKTYRELNDLGKGNPSALWVGLAKEALAEAEERVKYNDYLKQSPSAAKSP
ncbi:hypothetical protein CHS0354_018526 [Potamilus streckersoni]|uniref:Tetratricopeptide repeat protein n=1 Tax=Potamilus streckersoni TaxID=2493646 RepID=A0AAE0WB35_9BIVA|nr:hypothetical protein CHS0354_018526 [Potamilus streckersoni]